MLSDDQAAIERGIEWRFCRLCRLVELYQRRLMGLLVHACGSHHEAEDLMQEDVHPSLSKCCICFPGKASFIRGFAALR